MATRLKDVGVTLTLILLVYLNLLVARVNLDFKAKVFLVLFISLTQFVFLTPSVISIISLLSLCLFFTAQLPAIVSFYEPLFGLFPLSEFECFLLVLFIIVLLLILSSKVAKFSYFFRFPIVLISFYYIFIPWLLHKINLPQEFKHWLYLGLFIGNYYWWYFVFLIHDQRFLANGIIRNFGFIQPILMFTSLKQNQRPLLLGAKAYEEYSKNKVLRSERIKTIYFLIGNLFLCSVIYIQHRYFPMLEIKKFSNLFFDGKILFSHYAITVISFAIYKYCNLFAFMNIRLSLYRMGGVRYPSSVRPEMIKGGSFISFFSGFFFYIKEIYSQLFYVPVFLALNKIRSLKIRMGIATFIAVLAGTVLLHATLHYSFILKYGFCDFLVKFPSYWVNGILISVAIFTSQLFRLSKQSAKSTSTLMRMFKVMCYFLFLILTCFVEFWPSHLSLITIMNKYLSFLQY